MNAAEAEVAPRVEGDVGRECEGCAHATQVVLLPFAPLSAAWPVDRFRDREAYLALAIDQQRRAATEGECSGLGVAGQDWHRGLRLHQLGDDLKLQRTVGLD